MRLLSLLSVLLLFSAVSAQKKEISQARSYIKSRSNLEQAESSMRELLKDSANRRNIKIFSTLADALRTQYEVSNEKLYLKEKFDTASFFKVVNRMFLAYEGLDSMEALNKKNGKIKTKLRKKNSIFLHKLSKNLYNGGLYFIRNKNFDSAYDLMDTYIDCENQSLFSGLELKHCNDTVLRFSAAFWTVFCGYKLNRLDSALKYSELSVRDEKYKMRAFQYLAEIYLLKQDTVNYVKSLCNGFNGDKKSEFFFTRLMDYYDGKNLLDSAMYIVDSALEADEDNELFLFAKSNILLNQGLYNECVSICDTLLAHGSTLPDIYYNAGVSYINMTMLLEEDIASRKKNEKEILSYYQKALYYMEKYREFEPENKEKWASYLYNIYLNLNMGRQFEEISAILWDMR